MGLDYDYDFINILYHKNKSSAWLLKTNGHKINNKMSVNYENIKQIDYKKILLRLIKITRQKKRNFLLLAACSLWTIFYFGPRVYSDIGGENYSFKKWVA